MKKVPRGRRPAMSREQIVQCAMKLLARPGSEPLTLRAVARACGVAVGGLYRYFDSLADLEDEIAAGLLRQIPALDPTRPQSMREQLVVLGLELVRVYGLHPRLNQAFGPLSAASVGQQTRRIIQALLDIGVDLERAFTFYSMMFSAAYDWGTRESRMKPATPGRREKRILMQNLEGLAPQISRLMERHEDQDAYRRWLLERYVDAFLPELSGPPARRRRGSST